MLTQIFSQPMRNSLKTPVEADANYNETDIAQFPSWESSFQLAGNWHHSEMLFFGRWITHESMQQIVRGDRFS